MPDRTMCIVDRIELLEDVTDSQHTARLSEIMKLCSVSRGMKTTKVLA